MNRAWTIVGTILVAGTVALGQSNPDFASLERRMEDAQAALSRVERTVDSTEHTGLERDFKDLQDDLGYLRVKQRRGESVSDRDRTDLAARLDTFITRLNNRDSDDNSTRAIAVGTELDVRLQTPLSSRDATVEQRVEATTMVNLYKGDVLLVPAGSALVGYVAAVDRATRSDRKGSVSVQFSRLTVNNRTYDARVSVTQALESDGLKGEAGRIGAGSAVGAILGGILGGVKGAVTGILVGGGGVVLATEGKDVDLPSGTVLRVRFDSAVPLSD